MNENPYESPKRSDEPPRRSPLQNDNVREVLGIAGADFWYYPALALLIAACFMTNKWSVIGLFILSTAFLLIYLRKSYPKYLKASGLHPATKAYGLFGNAMLIVLQIGAVTWKMMRM